MPSQVGKSLWHLLFHVAGDGIVGLAGVPINDMGWGFIDQTGKVIIPPRYAWVYHGFRHGLVEVATGGKNGYINKKGEWVWPPSE